MASQGQLVADACESPSSCIAVGSYYNASGIAVTLAEIWRGSAWAKQTTPNPAGATQSALTSVSCPATTSCTAVGSYTNAGGVQETLAEGWNGSNWSLQNTPNPAGTTSGVFTGVSCGAATSCAAVGTYSTDGGATQLTLAEASANNVWTIQSTPNPAGSTDASLGGLSCVSASACTAVGSYTNKGGVQVTLAAGWTSHGWSIESTPNPKAADSSVLDSVACTSAVACTAVGGYFTQSYAPETLGETWNGVAWTIQKTANPAAIGSSRNMSQRPHIKNGGVAGPVVLLAISCTSPSSCSAVGYDANNGNQIEATLGEAWNGKTWAVEKTSTVPSSDNSLLGGVACESHTACLAVGWYANDVSGNDVPLAEGWSGSSWRIQKLAKSSGAATSELNGVSCSSATACTAVGAYEYGGGTLAERWNGSAWTIQKTPNPASTTYNVLDGVSCTSAAACVAVGNSNNNTLASSVVLIEKWNGSTWSIQTGPGGTSGTLDSVSCSAATACTAVGYSYSDEALAEAWNGTSWTVQSTPAIAGATVVMNGVSCSSASACTAVGYYYNGTVWVTLAEAWNGALWTIQSTPNPAGAAYSYLDGVSCVSSTACTAVGYYDTTTAGMTLAEDWNGTVWTIQNTPNPSAGDELQSVSCSSASACTAVGYYYYNSGQTEGMPVAEAWNGGTWTTQATANLAGATSIFLYGVSCAAGSCTAVGSEAIGSGIPVTLAEAESG